MKNLRLIRYTWRSFVSGLAIGALIIALLGVRLLGGVSSAATYSHNPIGYADDCDFENGSTVLYGWGHDPDAAAGASPSMQITVGGTAHVVSTNIAGYRDTPINAYIKNNYPGMPTSSIYGWKLVLSGLYKGSHNVVSAEALNVGSGANAAVKVHYGSYVDGDTSKAPFNSDYSIPDVCMATAPLPAPSPPPSSGGSTGSGSSSSSKSSSSKSSTTPSTPAPAPVTVSSAADSTITAGTSAVTMQFSVGNAASVYVAYGNRPTNLAFKSEGATISGAQATVTISGLDAQTTYSYQIVRTLGDKTTTSTVSSFVTAGYNLTLHFTNTQKQPVSGVSVSLDNQKATSDTKGNATLQDFAAGIYHPKFTYKGKSYTTALDTRKASSVEGAKVAAATTTINLDGLAKNAAVTPANGTPAWPFVLLTLAVLALLVFIIRRLRSRPKTTASYQSLDVIDNKSQHHGRKSHAAPPEPRPEHMGESLAQMVIESMRAENARRKNDQQ